MMVNVGARFVPTSFRYTQRIATQNLEPGAACPADGVIHRTERIVGVPVAVIGTSLVRPFGLTLRAVGIAVVRPVTAARPKTDMLWHYKTLAGTTYGLRGFGLCRNSSISSLGWSATAPTF